MNTPTREQIHAELTARLAAVDGSKASLAEAVRSCCREFGFGCSLTVGGHVIRWFSAECNLVGGRDAEHSILYTTDVLLIDGQVVEGPKFGVKYPDPSQNKVLSVFYGPEDGWYESGAWESYDERREQLLDRAPQDFYSLKKPRRLPLCNLSVLREVAAELADTLSRCVAEDFIGLDYDDDFIGLDAEVAQILEEEAALRKKESAP